MGMLRAIFTNAIRAAFPASVALSLDVAVMARCGNAGHGDYQCNNAMALTKALKSTPNYKGKVEYAILCDRTN
jgi:arginyl-tRNA synthetase